MRETLRPFAPSPFNTGTRIRVVATYSTPSEAHIARSRLESAGINAAVRDEFTVTFNWLYSNAVGGVKIEVSDEDEAAAREILELPATVRAKDKAWRVCLAQSASS